MTRRLGRRAAMGALLATGCGGAVLELASASPRTRRRIEVADGVVAFELQQPAPLSDGVFAGWIERAATMVAATIGRLPAPVVPVRVVTRGAGGVEFGQHTLEGLTVVYVGQGATRGDLERDAILVHELLHGAFPRIRRRGRWMREGLSTYLETLLRAQAGILGWDELWSIWARRMPLGAGPPRVPGLDHHRSWASTYWGGALYWLTCDVALHERGTSLREVLTHIASRGGDARQRWSKARLFEIAGEVDDGVLRARYEALGSARVRERVDVERLLTDLGVDGDENAPRAAVRRSIEAQRIAIPSLLSA